MHTTDFVQDERLRASDEKVSADKTRQLQTTFKKILRIERNAILISIRAARYLGDKHISAKNMQHKSGPPLRVLKIREWKVKNDDIAAHKCFQASSSCGVFHRFASEEDALIKGAIRPFSARNPATSSSARISMRSSNAMMTTRFPSLNALLRISCGITTCPFPVIVTVRKCCNSDDVVDDILTSKMSNIKKPPKKLLYRK